MPAFVGLDLAWTPHHASGVCIVIGDTRGVELLTLECVTASPGAFADLCANLGDDVIVAVDAPLVVRPERVAERQLARAFGTYKAGAYSANLEFLTKMNGLAGPMLAAELSQRGFSVIPSSLLRYAAGRIAVEVFPHPAHVVLFDLQERLKYKKGVVSARRKVMRGYQEHLSRLLTSEMPGVLAHPLMQSALEPSATDAAGRALKDLEDRLDAITCVYVAYHCWKHGPDGYRVFGNDEHGAIVTPLRVPATSDPARSSP